MRKSFPLPAFVSVVLLLIASDVMSQTTVYTTTNNDQPDPKTRSFAQLHEAEGFMRQDVAPLECKSDLVLNPSSGTGGSLAGWTYSYHVPEPEAAEGPYWHSYYAVQFYGAHSAQCGSSAGCASEDDLIANIFRITKDTVFGVGAYTAIPTRWGFGGHTMQDGSYRYAVGGEMNVQGCGGTRKLDVPPNENMLWWSPGRVDYFLCPVGYGAGIGSNNCGSERTAWPNVCICETKASIVGFMKQLPVECPAGNPCSPSTGDKSQKETDFVWGEVEFSRSYHSLQQLPVTSALGSLWEHALAIRLLPSSDTRPAYIETEEHEIEQFKFFGTVGSTNRYRAVSEEGLILESDPNPQSPTTRLWVLKRPNGQRLHFDAAGALIRIEFIDRPERSVTLSYCAPSDGAPCVTPGKLKTATDGRGRRLDFFYTTLAATGGQAFLDHVDADGQQLVAYGYDSAGRLMTATYPGETAPVSRTYHYDEPTHVCVTADGNPVTPCNPAPNLLTGITDEKGVRYAHFKYDGQSRAVLTTYLDGANRHALEYLSSNTTRVTGPLGQQWTLTYGASEFRKLGSKVDAEGTMSQGYDAEQRLTSRIDKRGTNSTYEYADGVHETARNEAVGKPEQRRTETDWSSAHNRVTERRTRNKAGQLVEHGINRYNARGQVEQVEKVDPVTNARRTTTYRYCEAADVADVTAGCPILGLLKELDGPRTDVADVTRYRYYAANDPDCGTAPSTCTYRRGDLQMVTDAAGATTTYIAYDYAGRVIASEDANQVLTEFVYDARGRLRKKIVNGPAVAVTEIRYDPAGQVERVIQPDGSYTIYGYDASHRLTSITDRLGNSITYTLDAAGNRTHEDTKDPSGALRRTMGRVYDSLGRLERTLDANAEATVLTYDPNRNVDLTTDALGRVQDNDYDPLNRLVKTIADYGVGRINATTGYEYDAADRLVAVTDPKGLVTQYVHDAFGDQRELHSPDTGSTIYTYDEAGNRATQTDARGVVSTYSYDALNRLKTITYADASQNVGFFYDVAQPECQAGETLSVGRLVRMTDKSGETRLCYDGRGNVVRKLQRVGSVTDVVQYGYDVADQIKSITYPGGSLVEYGHNTAGQTVSVQYRSSAGATAVPIVTNVSYLPFGPVKQVNYAGGRTLSKTYDLNYAIDAVTSSASAGLSLDFKVDAVGNITALNGESARTYQYDALDRLSEGQGVQQCVDRSVHLRRHREPVNEATRCEPFHGLPVSLQHASSGSNRRCYACV